MKHLCFTLGLLAVLGLGLGCGDDDASTNPTPDGTASIRVMLTDAPADYISSAEVVISRVYLVAAAPDSSEDSTAAPAAAIDLLPDGSDPLVFDLMELRNGLEALLGEIQVPEGLYHQLRLVVEDATVTLAEGHTFPDGGDTETLKTPSGHSSGIKVKLDEPIPAEEGMVTIVTVDFDVNDNFVLQGNPETPAGIKGVLFKPVLKEKHRAQEEDDTGEGDGE